MTLCLCSHQPNVYEADMKEDLEPFNQLTPNMSHISLFAPHHHFSWRSCPISNEVMPLTAMHLSMPLTSIWLIVTRLSSPTSSSSSAWYGPRYALRNLAASSSSRLAGTDLPPGFSSAALCPLVSADCPPASFPSTAWRPAFKWLRGYLIDTGWNDDWASRHYIIDEFISMTNLLWIVHDSLSGGDWWVMCSLFWKHA